jgi:asparagine synthase (glutamine-hydrolysing)
MSLPSEYIIANGRGKFIQREALKPLLPTEVYSSTMKLGFPSPSQDFLDNQRNNVRELLLDSRAKGRGIISSGNLEKLLDSSFNKYNHPDRFIFRLICLELWFREFIDQG